VNLLTERALDFLARVWSDERALFPFTTRLDGGGRERSEYDDPLARRYTLISLLGLQRAAAGGDHAFAARAGELIERFLARHRQSIDSRADLGLLLLLLAEGDRDAALAGELVRGLGAGNLARLSMQDLSWMLWAACEAAARGTPGAPEAASRLWREIAGSFVDPRSGLARHVLSPLRRRLVSFGSTTYFLRCASEAARLGHDGAAGTFRRGVERVLGLQGPNGEWPWMIDVARGKAVDVHPVFSVHQLSMAMLFLHPAVEAGVPGAADAIERSFAWVRGENELALPLAVDGGRFVYRSIERVDRWPLNSWPRAGRYLRSTAKVVMRREDSFAARPRVRLNPESRSYEWGWIAYVWAARDATPPFSDPI
jgi:hypothetical protein